MSTAKERNPDPEWVSEARMALKTDSGAVSSRLLALAIEEYDRTHTEEIMAAMEDLLSHRDPWRKAMVIAKTHAEFAPPEVDDRSYWDHQLRAFDRTFDALSKNEEPEADTVTDHHLGHRNGPTAP
jgi:hypothetical protein